MRYYKVIADVKEIEKMVNLLPELKVQEAFFMSLAIRKKYLTDEVRKELGPGVKEMFGQTLVRDRTVKDFVRKLSRLETNANGFTARNGMAYPQVGMACYLNINASDMLVAANNLQIKLHKYTNEILKATMNGSNCDSYLKKMSKLDTELMSCAQKAKGSSTFIDIDLDIDKVTERGALTELVNFLKKNNIKYHVIETRSGYHVLLKRKTIKCNYTLILHSLDKHVAKEVVLNENNMIPFPGTYQGNFVVKFLDM